MLNHCADSDRVMCKHKHACVLHMTRSLSAHRTFEFCEDELSFALLRLVCVSMQGQSAGKQSHVIELERRAHVAARVREEMTTCPSSALYSTTSDLDSTVDLPGEHARSHTATIRGHTQAHTFARPLKWHRCTSGHANDLLRKILFRNGELTLLLPGSGCPLQAGTGHGRPGRTPGRC
jgi:hypothetical protein